MALTLRSNKGSVLTHAEMDENLRICSSRSEHFNVFGVVSPSIGTQRWYAPYRIHIGEVRLHIGEVSSTIVSADLKKNGVSILGSQELTLGIDEFVGATLTLDVIVEEEDYLTVDVLSGDGKDLTVRIKYKLI